MNLLSRSVSHEMYGKRRSLDVTAHVDFQMCLVNSYPEEIPEMVKTLLSMLPHAYFSARCNSTAQDGCPLKAYFEGAKLLKSDIRIQSTDCRISDGVDVEILHHLWTSLDEIGDVGFSRKPR